MCVYVSYFNLTVFYIFIYLGKRITLQAINIKEYYDIGKNVSIVISFFSMWCDIINEYVGIISGFIIDNKTMEQIEKY